MKIGIFGGTFNPVHYGHLRSAEEVREKFGLDRIFFIPSGNPPLKRKDLTEAVHRHAMVKMAARDNPSFEVLDIECVRPGKSYTVNTLEQLLENYVDADLYFILGIDAFLDIPNWREPEKILSLTNFIVLSRPGNYFTDLFHSPYLDMKKNVLASLDREDREPCVTVLKSGKKSFLTSVTPIGISSTDIRKCVRKGFSIKYLLPAEVESYIISHSLYMQKNRLKRIRGRRECL
ncbi:MAG: nicotinate-nucleotide adenylyltransferase [Nitrospiraceae bacterium]|jgi:nicotinate-nucleotide adenylyltransferase|nr:MAG: nicotinate-nucleotide adenylyltransferase [Nitrospiraceae bacterium]